MILGEGVFIPKAYCGKVARRLLRDARAQPGIGALWPLKGLVLELQEVSGALEPPTSPERGTSDVPLVAGDSDLSSPGLGIAAGQAAERLGVDVTYVRRLCRWGRLPGAYQIPGGSWLIPEDAVTEFHLERTRNDRTDRAS